MALSSTEQFFSSLEQSENPLIVLPEDPSGDVLSAGYALAQYFLDKEKEAVLVYTNFFSGVYDLSFLPQPKNIRHDLLGVRDFVLMFDTSRNPIENVRTERENNALHIYLTPKKGSIDPRDFSFVPAKMPYDCAFILGARDKESLGGLYEESADILFEIPLVNIDFRNNNERFAQTNIVEVTASGVSEVLTSMFMRNAEKESISSETAQCLLAGIIMGTDSFQSPLTTPKSFQLAAQLIDKGADQHEIIRHVYKTQPLHILKLLGRVLTKLQVEVSSGLVWTMIDLEDFVQSRAEVKDLMNVLEKVRSHYSSGNYFLFLYETKKGEFSGILRAKNESAYERLQKYIPGSLQGDYYVFHQNKIFSQEFIRELSQKLSLD